MDDPRTPSETECGNAARDPGAKAPTGDAEWTLVEDSETAKQRWNDRINEQRAEKDREDSWKLKNPRTTLTDFEEESNENESGVDEELWNEKGGQWEEGLAAEWEVVG
ncbi:unnamed protein product [Zymoseptoria tritici ST99CH_1A5]|uniref:Uncharacterized protein n=1 Tax=Zymoseptoria tritici ST99CH_1A5 TaxID=1276529 RepID=A0A1Y6M127_ZYMTR|nr:unnamed protein product [Zymoseptoria tritici ST99CH_1A5]